MGLLDSVGQAFKKFVVPPPPPKKVEPPPTDVARSPERNTVLERSSFRAAPTSVAPTDGGKGGGDVGEDAGTGRAKTAGEVPPARDDKEAVELLQRSLEGQGAGGPGINGGTVTANPAEVDTASATPAQAVVAAEPRERAAVSRLSPEDQESYRRLRETTNADPAATASLQQTLLTGQLTNAPPAGGPRVIDSLTAINDPARPRAAGVDPQQLTREVLREIATPEAIGQGGRGTCAPTTMLQKLANEDPAEYARIAEGLSTEKGAVVLRGGMTLAREDGSLSPQADAGRSTSQRLMSDALMEVANGDRDYDPLTDNGAGGDFEEGMPIAQGQLFGREFESEMLSENDPEAIPGLRDQLATQAATSVSIHPDETGTQEGHQVLVTSIEQENGRDVVNYTNPWGQAEQMDAVEFQRRMYAMTATV